MFKYGNSRPLNYISNSTNRNIVYKTSDKITANIAPTQLFDILSTSSVSANDISVQLVKTGQLESDSANLTEIGTNIITTRDGNFIRLVDPLIVTNMKNNTEEELLQYVETLSNDLITSFNESSFNIILNRDNVYSKKNTTIYVDNCYFEANSLNLVIDEITIKDNIIQFNTNNKNNTHNISGFNFKVNDYRNVSPSKAAENMILFVPNIEKSSVSDVVSMFTEDSVRFQNIDVDIFNYYHNAKFVRNTFETFDTSIIDKMNGNVYQTDFYLPIEVDRLIVHNGDIINSNEEGNITFKLYQDTTLSVVSYKNMFELLNSTTTSPNRYSNFNTSVRFNSNGSIEPRIYFDGELYFSNSTNIDTTTETATLSDYFLHLSNDDVNIKKNLVFTDNTNNKIKGGDMEFTFDTSLKITDADGNGDLTVDKNGNFTINGNLAITGSATTSIKSTNTTIDDNIIELSSGLTTTETGDSGIIIERGLSGDNAFIGWDSSAGKFILGTTTATGTSTGNLTIANGELQIKGIDSGSDNFILNTSGTILLTASTVKTSSNMTVAGDLTVTGNDITFGNGETISNDTDGTILLTASTVKTSSNMTVAGDLTVTGNDITFGNGETISNDTDGTILLTASTVKTSSNIIELSSGLTTVEIGDSGIIIERGSSGDNAFIGWDSSAGKFILGTTTATGTSTGNLTISNGELQIKGIDSGSDNFTFTSPNVIVDSLFTLKNGDTSAGKIEFYEKSSNGSHKITLLGVDNLTADHTLTLSTSGGTIITTNDLATDTDKGISSFDTNDFSVTAAGSVSIKSKGVSNSQLENSKLVIGDVSINLGETKTNITGLTSVETDSLACNDFVIIYNDTVRTKDTIKKRFDVLSEPVFTNDNLIGIDETNKKVHFNSLIDSTGNIFDTILNDNGGNVCIGTNTADTLLHLENDEPYITLKNSTSDTNGDGGESRIIFKNNEGYELSRIQGSQHKDNIDKNGNLIFSTNDGAIITEALRIDGEQNIGIGTSSVKKDRKLHVSTAGSSYMRLSGFVGTAAKEKYLEFGSVSEFNAIYSREKDSVDNSDSTADGTETTLKIISGDFHITNSADNDRMVIKEDGKVGIGTNNPSSTSILTIKKDSSEPKGTSTTMIDFLVKNSNTTDGFDDTILATIEAGHSNVSADTNYRSGFISFKTNFMEDVKGTYVDRFLERMRIEANGNIGIGTTSPDSTLHVNGVTHLEGETHIDNPNIKLGGDDTKDKGIRFVYKPGVAYTDPYNGFFGYDYSEGNFIFKKEITDIDGIITGTTGEIVADLKGTVNQVEQNSITTMNSLTSIGSTGNTTTIKGPIVFNQGFGASSNVLTTSQDITSGGTYIVNNAVSIDLTLGSLTTGTLITLYGGGVSDYTLTGVDAITINNQDKKLAIPKTSTVICIATGTDSWVAYVDGTYPTPA